MASGQSSSPQHEVTAFGRSLRATGLGRRFEMDKRAPGSQVWLGPVHKVAQKPPGFCSMWPVSVCVCVCVCVLVRVSIPAQTSWPRSKLGRKGFILLTLPHSCSSPKEVRTGTQAGQDAGADAKAVEGMFLTGLLPLACSACSLVEPKDTSPEMGPPTRGPPPLEH